jgi:tRNA-Thr(GGU) m(6)t(6)A37 methyltransferase TsaA
MQSIGAFSSCFQEKYGTPRQGQVTSFSRGRLQLHSHISPDALAGLDQYSHVWLVFVFDLNDGVGDGVAHSGRGGRFKAKVRAPRLRGGKLGVFATRTPHRVNPIGLSLARLDRIVGGTLHLSGVDLVSGTPVLDLKPYHPADAVPSATARVPQWMHDAPPALRASFHRSAERQLLSLFQDDKQPQPVLDFYDRCAPLGPSGPALDTALDMRVPTHSTQRTPLPLSSHPAPAYHLLANGLMGRRNYCGPLDCRYDDIHQAILQVIRADPRTTHSHSKSNVACPR